MSFSDLLTSSRGPGVIGTLLALLIIVGFGTLYMFVFDEGLQGGGKRIEAVIRDQGLEIDGLQKHIANSRERIAEGQAFVKQADGITQLEARAELERKRIAGLETDRDAAQAELEAAHKKFEDYKDAYRASEWAAAVGERFEELKTASGVVYNRAVIRKVDHIGVEITDETGNRRIDSAELPSELQDRFQFDSDKKEAAATEEDEIFKTHSGNVQIATLAKQAQDKLIQVRNLQEKIRKAEAGIRRFKADEPRMRLAIDKKKADIARERSKKGVSRTHEMQVDLRQMEDAYGSARRSVPGFEKEIRESKTSITRLDREVNDIKREIARLKDADAAASGK